MLLQKNIPLCRFWNEERLKKEMRIIGPSEFDRGYRQKAMSDEDLLFPSFDKSIKRGFYIKDVLGLHWKTFTAVDLSSDKRPGNAIVTIKVAQDHKRYPVDIRMGAWSSPDTARKINEVDRLWKPDVVLVENNAYQQSIIDWCMESKEEFTFWTKLEAFTTGKQKSDPAIGLPSLEVEFFNDAWFFCADEIAGHDVACDCGFCTWIKDMRRMTIYDLKGTPDVVMATWFVREAARMYTIPSIDKLNEPTDEDKYKPITGTMDKEF